MSVVAVVQANVDLLLFKVCYCDSKEQALDSFHIISDAIII